MNAGCMYTSLNQGQILLTPKGPRLRPLSAWDACCSQRALEAEPKESVLQLMTCWGSTVRVMHVRKPSWNVGELQAPLRKRCRGSG